MSQNQPPRRLTRDELIELVTRILHLEAHGPELDEWVSQLIENVPHPKVSDMIFWPDKQRSAEQIVDEALAWDGKPSDEYRRGPLSLPDDHSPE